MSSDSTPDKVAKIFIADLKDKQAVATQFVARNKVLLKDKKGKAYISLLLSDCSGDMDSKIWDNVEAIDRAFESGDIVSVRGVVQLYQNRMQFIIHKLERFSGDTDMTQFLKKSNVEPEAIFLELQSIVASVKDHHVRQLLSDTITDEEIKPLLMISPAAKSVHHAKLGGLIEHIVSICRLANVVTPLYPAVNRDLVLFGAVFHDIGKIWEFKIDQGGISYTDQGRLIGHMAMGVELIERKASKIPQFPSALKDLCKHIVLSHHGKYEYGSPKLPQTLEAYVVWMLDDMDSKIDSIQSAMSIASHDANWSQHSQLFDRYFYLKGKQWDS
ncbi:MAG: HD domain-containing protein [Bdellovibrionales bacterium]|nr:HD domain-containing protein [Bdellovibrionales bacterium]